MAILGEKTNLGNQQSKEVFHLPSSKSALIVFTRNPELGKCKTRLAATIGDQSALDVYRFLLDHTVKITTPLSADVYVYYSEKIKDVDIWDLSLIHISEPTRQAEISYAVFCLKKKKKQQKNTTQREV